MARSTITVAKTQGSSKLLCWYTAQIARLPQTRRIPSSHGEPYVLPKGPAKRQKTGQLTYPQYSLSDLGSANSGGPSSTHNTPACCGSLGCICATVEPPPLGFSYPAPGQSYTCQNTPNAISGCSANDPGADGMHLAAGSYQTTSSSPFTWYVYILQGGPALARRADRIVPPTPLVSFNILSSRRV